MEEHTIGKTTKELARRIGKDPINCTAKSMRGLVAIQLSEVGICVSGSQIVGNWKGSTAPMERMEHKNKACNYKMRILIGE